MITQELTIPPAADLATVVARVEACCAAVGLRLTRKGPQAQYPGCVHWHYKQGAQPGTLEITLWPAARRLWFPLRAGRAAPWITDLLAQLGPAIEQALAIS